MYRKPGINQLDRHIGPCLYKAAAVRDAAGVDARPGAVAVDEHGRILAAGEPAHVAESVDHGISTIELPDRLLIPGLVNAHTHLDLTDIGYEPYDGDFLAWVKMVMQRRPVKAEDVRAAVEHGIRLSRVSGVLTVGDIAGSPEATAGIIDSPLRGVSFIELFGLGVDYIHDDLAYPTQVARWSDLHATADVAMGFQPHAPYSAGPGLYGIAGSSTRFTKRRLATHLAETPQELEFVRSGSGPFRELLIELNKWKPAYEGLYGEGLHPVDWLARATSSPVPWLCAHCNYVDDDHIQKLATLGWSVAYCPRATDYFEHPRHRYRDMLAAGVNVCLGTDSLICHGSLSILDEMRYLHQHDGTDPATLLAMATTNGLRALQLNANDATFTPGARPGLIALHYDPHSRVDPLVQTLASKENIDIEVIEGVTAS